MGKALKIILSIIGIIIVLFIAAVIILTTVIDPNKYKVVMEQYVYEKTGRHVDILGKMKWSFFPWLGLDMPKVVIGNPPNFKGPDLAKIQDLQFKVRLAPLILGNVQIKEIKLKNAVINLITAPNNKTNWGSWVNPHAKSLPKPKAQPQKKSRAIPIRSLSIKNLAITGSTINIINHKTNTTWIFSKINCSLKNMESKMDFPLKLSFTFKRKDSPNVIKTRLNTTANINLDTEQMILPKVDLENVLIRPKLPKLPFGLFGKLQFNPYLQTLRLNSGIIKFANLQLHANISIDRLFSVPSIKATINSKDTQLKPLLTALRGSSFATGLLSFKTNLTAQGANNHQILSSLNGTGNISIKQGAILAFNTEHFLAQAAAFIHKKPQPKTPEGPVQTPFSFITASYTINHGILSNQDLKLQGNQLHAKGKGQINFPQHSINYQFAAQYDYKADQQDQAFWLPIMITGSLSKPTIQPDYAAITKSFIKGQIKDYLDKNSKKIGNVLKGLFN